MKKLLGLFFLNPFNGTEGIKRYEKYSRVKASYLLASIQDLITHVQTTKSYAFITTFVCVFPGLVLFPLPLLLLPSVLMFLLAVNQSKTQTGCVTQKGLLRPESLSHQKKDGRAWPRPSCFWYDTDFWDLFFIFFFWKATRTHPSFGMTTTRDIRDLFVWRRICFKDFDQFEIILLSNTNNHAVLAY